MVTPAISTNCNVMSAASISKPIDGTAKLAECAAKPTNYATMSDVTPARPADYIAISVVRAAKSIDGIARLANW